MRVLLVTGSYPPMKCGVGAYTQRLAQALARVTTCEVMVFSGRQAKEDKEPRISLYAEAKGWRLPQLGAIVCRIWQLRPDVVHIQFPTQGYYQGGGAAFLLPLVLRVLRIRCVQTWHEPIGLTRLAWLLGLGLGTLVSVRPNVTQQALPSVRKLLRSKRFVWIPSSSMLPTEVLSKVERQRIKAQYVEKHRTWFFVFYGFVAPLKGIETLFELVAQTDSRLVLASDISSENPYHRSLLHHIETLGIQARVEVLGFQSDESLARLLAAADAAIFPFPAGAAPWNTSVDGAVAQGTFVLTTTQGESHYDKARHTYFAQPQNIEEMIEALYQYAGKFVSPKDSLASWDEIANLHMAVYREMVKE